MESTSRVFVNNSDAKASEALKMADEFISKQGLDRKKAIHLRLIAEETIGMVRAMAGEFQALFWLEQDGDEYKVRLSAKTDMNMTKKDELLSVSSSGKNASVKGFMGKISEIIENGLLNYDEVMSLQQKYDGGSVSYAYMGFGLMGELPAMGQQLVWSLNSYKEQLENADDEDKPAQQAWDELEKSIVASIAKDVTVGVKKDRVEMTIIAK